MIKKANKKNKQVPVILQTQNAESGAIALAMIFAYHDLFVPPEKMRSECGVTTNGTNKDRLIIAAKKYGFDSQFSMCDLISIKEKTTPLLIGWDKNNFVVLSDIINDKYIINDPDSGRKKISKEEFQSHFNSLVLEFETNDNFVAGGKKKSVINSLAERMSGSKKDLIFVLICGLLLIIPGILIPGFYKVFIDDVLVFKQTDWYRPLMLAMGIVLIFNALVTWLQQKVLLKLEIKLALSQSAKFFMHVFKLPLSFFQERHSGEIIKRVQLNDTLAQVLSEDLAKNTLNLLSIIFFAVIMFYYNVILTIIGVSFALINLITLKIISTKKITLNQKQFQNRGKTFSTGGIGLEMIETIKSTGNENDFFSLWSGYQAEMVNKDQELGLTDRFLDALPDFLNNLNNIIIISFGALLIIHGEITIGLLIAFQSLMSNFSAPIKELVGMGGKLEEAISYVRTIDDAMSNPIDQVYINEQKIEKKEFLLEEAKLTGHLELKNITFGYDNFEKPLISNFSLNIEPGKRVALIGGSGSGKSTIAKIAMGLYLPWDGQIIIDGKELKNYHLEVFSNSLAMVDQDIFLFMGTVNDNISMWNKNIKKSDIIAAGKDAVIHDIISVRPNAYDSMVAPGGANFSGGQKQRIEIARALAKNPTILVLDEATSALDPNTEQIIDNNIRQRGCTTLIIAHRLSTIRDCDEIIVMDRGKVVQRGTHEEMMQDKNGSYYKLIKLS